jgi:membrane-bound lytic murein transglycosylase F
MDLTEFDQNPKIDYEREAAKIIERKSFNGWFREASELWFGQKFDWNRFRVQAWWESHLNPKAISRCGAKGLMQIMPSTWEEIKTQSGMIDLRNPFNARQSIFAGIFYMKKQWDRWEKDKSSWDFERLWLYSLAAYNAGWGNIHRALIQCLRDHPIKEAIKWSAWDVVASYLPDITGDHAGETIHYVFNIAQTYEAMKKLLANGLIDLVKR